MVLPAQVLCPGSCTAVCLGGRCLLQALLWPWRLFPHTLPWTDQTTAQLLSPAVVLRPDLFTWAHLFITWWEAAIFWFNRRQKHILGMTQQRGCLQASAVSGFSILIVLHILENHDSLAAETYSCSPCKTQERCQQDARMSPEATWADIWQADSQPHSIGRLQDCTSRGHAYSSLSFVPSVQCRGSAQMAWLC